MFQLQIDHSIFCTMKMDLINLHIIKYKSLSTLGRSRTILNLAKFYLPTEQSLQGNTAEYIIHMNGLYKALMAIKYQQ